MDERASRSISRRDLLVGLAGAAVVAKASDVAAQTPRRAGTPPSRSQGQPARAGSPPTPPAADGPPALRGNHEPVALPFDPHTLRGLSERMMTSHHDNNYVSAVRNLNRVEQELAKIDANTPPFLVASLHERELQFRNSKTFHEAYFANLGGDGRRSGAIAAALAAAYGGAAAWEMQVRASGKGLGGGSGWVVLGLELETERLRTFSCVNHTQDLALAAPLLVMDMYEHAYQMDFGADHARYIDAFFDNVGWEVVNRRFERAKRASQALRANG